MCTYAAMNGHLSVLQWARAQGCPEYEDEDDDDDNEGDYYVVL